MDEEGIKKQLCKKPIAKLLIISLFVVLLLLYIAERKDYLVTLIFPITITDGQEGKDFLYDTRDVVGNLKELPLCYIGYDTLIEYVEESGEVLNTQKVGSVYYVWIDGMIVLCEYGDSAKEPKPHLFGKWQLCYTKDFSDDPVMYDIRREVIEQMAKEENGIKPIDFATRTLYLMPTDQMLFEWANAVGILLLTLVLIGVWLKCMQITVSIRLCSSIRNAIKQYGSLPQIYEKVAKENNLLLTDEVLLTKNWLIHWKAKEIIYCEDIIWIYHKLCPIPIDFSSTYICTKDGRKHHIYNICTRNIYEIYDRIKEKRPWIVEGYTKERHKAWHAGIDAFTAYCTKKEGSEFNQPIEEQMNEEEQDDKDKDE